MKLWYRVVILLWFWIIRSWALLKFLIPVGMFAVYFVIIAHLNRTYSGIIPLMLAYSLPPFGKESIIPTAIAMGITPVTMLFLIIYIDLTFAILIIWNYDLIYKMPLFGKILRKIEGLGMRAWEEHTWTSNVIFIGLIIFVFIPFHGTGATTSAIIGRAIGIQPLKVFVAITIGSVTGASFVVLFSNAFRIVFGKEILLALGLFLMTVILIRFVRGRA